MKITITRRFVGNPALVWAGRILPHRVEHWLLYASISPRATHQWRRAIRRYLDRFKRYEPVDPYTIDIG